MTAKKKPADRTPKPKPTVKRTVQKVKLSAPEPFLPPESPEPPDKRPSTFYDEQYLRKRGRWEDSPTFQQIAMNLFSVMKNLGLKTNSNILDVGCGRGFIVRWLRNLQFLNVHGVEYGDTAVVHSVCDADRIDLTKPLTLCSNMADFAYCFDALEGIPNGYRPLALVEIFRIVARGGHLLTNLLASDRKIWRDDFLAAGWEERHDLEPLLISLGYNGSPEQWMTIWTKK